MNWALLQEQLVGKSVVKRAKHGIHFDNGDGQILANFSGKPCHYFDGGLWKPIDTKLLVASGGYYGCPHSDVQVHPDGRVKVVGTDYTQYTELPTAPVGSVDGDRIVREFTGGRQYLYVTEDGFKQEIILDTIPSLKLADARKLLATVYGSLPLKYVASKLTATDANGATYTYANTTEMIAWLQAAVYPVVIDPDFASDTNDAFIYGRNTVYATARSTSLDYTSSVTATIGQSWIDPNFRVYRGFLSFDTSAIGAGSTVTQVNLKMVLNNDASNTDFDVQIAKYDWSQWYGEPTNTTYRETAYDGCLSADADDSVFANTNGIAIKPTQITSGNLNTAWVSKTGRTYYGLRSSLDVAGTQPSGLEYVDICTFDNATESYRPVLTVTYTAAATGGTGLLIPNIFESEILNSRIVR
jgi:hypothetical protein